MFVHTGCLEQNAPTTMITTRQNAYNEIYSRKSTRKDNLFWKTMDSFFHWFYLVKSHECACCQHGIIFTPSYVFHCIQILTITWLNNWITHVCVSLFTCINTFLRRITEPMWQRNASFTSTCAHHLNKMKQHIVLNSVSVCVMIIRCVLMLSHV